MKGRQGNSVTKEQIKKKQNERQDINEVLFLLLTDCKQHMVP